MTMERHEPQYEIVLAERIASIRVALTMMNALLLALDRGLILDQGPQGFAMALGAAGLFVAYAAVLRLALGTGQLSARAYQLVSPFGDVMFASILIGLTKPQDNPLVLWLALAIVASGFSHFVKLPLAVTLAAILAQCAVQFLHPSPGFDTSAFAFGTLYLLGFAALVASLAGSVVRQSDALAATERLGRLMAEARSEDDACRSFTHEVRDFLRASVLRMTGPGDAEVCLGRPPELVPPTAAWEVEAEEGYSASIEAWRQSKLSNEEDYVVRVGASRLAAAIRRSRMSDELVRSAALEERLRFADELHDTYLQTLAAIDMHAEAARIVLQKGADSGERVHEELQSIKSVARTTAQRAREFVDMAKVARRSGPDALTEILEDRWKDCYTLLFDEDVQLTEGQWKVLEMMLREGLNNAKRHAGASHVRMEVVATGRGAKATLIANGKAPAPDEPFGYGLSRLDAIARANNGVLSLLPGDPGGSELTLSFQRRKL